MTVFQPNTCPSTVSWKHLPTISFCRLCVLAWPFSCPLEGNCLLPCSLGCSCPFPGCERCWTEWTPSVLASLCPGWTRATWWTWTSASGGCWMWTFTKDGCRDTWGQELESLFKRAESLEFQSWNNVNPFKNHFMYSRVLSWHWATFCATTTFHSLSFHFRLIQ